jgi:alkanesulfonate monooxygenase SsuD/methylene tetrahydromethanopterin reductase-like flavin-dependent oxidoreductase (luciferase family)
MSRIGVYFTAPDDASADDIIERARAADAQGFDTFWLPDHLTDYRGASHVSTGPFDSFTLMVAIGASTQRIRLAWGMLNPTFRNPALLAKMLATLDHITHGRVICSIGAGWLRSEYDAYGLTFIQDHDERIAHEREVIRLLKELWTRPAPERVTFEGRYVQTNELPFNPAPYQSPHPPVWVGGDSDATLALAREEGDGWVPIVRSERDVLRGLREAGDCPEGLSVIRMCKIIVAETRQQAVEEARAAYEIAAAGPYNAAADFGDYLTRQVVGTPEECLERLGEDESAGIDHHVASFDTRDQQDRAARLLLPLLAPAAV